MEMDQYLIIFICYRQQEDSFFPHNPKSNLEKVHLEKWYSSFSQTSAITWHVNVSVVSQGLCSCRSGRLLFASGTVVISVIDYLSMDLPAHGSAEKTILSIRHTFITLRTRRVCGVILVRTRQCHVLPTLQGTFSSIQSIQEFHFSSQVTLTTSLNLLFFNFHWALRKQPILWKIKCWGKKLTSRSKGKHLLL